MHAHARLSTADRDRLACGLTKTLGGTPKQEAHERASARECVGATTRGRLS
jgi:hypothetical protein